MLPVKKDVFLFHDSLFTDAASPRKKKKKIGEQNRCLILRGGVVCAQANFMSVV